MVSFEWLSVFGNLPDVHGDGHFLLGERGNGQVADEPVRQVVFVQYVEQVVEYLAAGFGDPGLAAALQHGADVPGDVFGKVLFIHDVASPDIVEALGGELGLAPVFYLPVHARNAVQEFVDLGVFKGLGFVVHSGDFRTQPAAHERSEAYAAPHIEAVLSADIVLHFGQPAGEGQGRGPYLVPVGQAVFAAFLLFHASPKLVHIGTAEMPYLSTGLEYAVKGSVGFHVVSFFGGMPDAGEYNRSSPGSEAPAGPNAVGGTAFSADPAAQGHILALAGIGYCGYHTS